MFNSDIEYITVWEAAMYLRVSRSKIYTLIHIYDLPHTRLGRYIRIPTAEFNRWISDHTYPSTN